MCKEVLPGDTWQVQSTTMVRFAPMLAPIMHRVNVYVHYFFVPNRILWSDFEDFITGGKDGTANPTFPFVDLSTFDYEDDDQYAFVKPGSLWDYLGLPTYSTADGTKVQDGIQSLDKVSLLPFAGYRKIYEDYYKDQNLEDEFDVKEFIDAYGDTGVNVAQMAELFPLQKRAWEKDYFTSALPWPQRGGDVHLPLTGDAPVDGEVYLSPYGAGDNPAQLIRPAFGETLSTGGSYRNLHADGTGEDVGVLVTSQSSGANATTSLFDPNHTLKVEGIADLSDVTSATINELRRSVRLQEWLEKNARSGARYIEQILSHFGVRSSDGRLDRAEYLGGGKAPISISEVLQTSESGTKTPLADMAGHGIGVGTSNKFRKFFEEHGYVFGIMSILPRSSYSGGVPRHFTKFDKFDFAWPEFANLGEQEILNKELNLTGNTENDNKVFGYTPRYAEYKFSLNEFHGSFRDTMSYWHLGRMFPKNSVVPLNSDFVHVDQDNDNLNRIFAVQDSTQRHLLVECYNKITVKRTLPKFGVPTL